MGLLSCRHVTKSYGVERALAGLDLNVEEGQTVAVMGPSGSGKSTLLHCVAGLTAPDLGTIRIDGVDVWSLDDNERATLRRESVGMVYQTGYLVDELACVDNVALPALASGVRRREAQATARELLGELGVGQHHHKRPYELSGGERQRVAIARALVNGPRLILADEPTGSLDQSTGHAVLDLLLGAVSARQQGALVMVTHDPAVAARAQRVLTIVDGQDAGGSV